MSEGVVEVRMADQIACLTSLIADETLAAGMLAAAPDESDWDGFFTRLEIRAR